MEVINQLAGYIRLLLFVEWLQISGIQLGRAKPVCPNKKDGGGLTIAIAVIGTNENRNIRK